MRAYKTKSALQGRQCQSIKLKLCQIITLIVWVKLTPPLAEFDIRRALSQAPNNALVVTAPLAQFDLVSEGISQWGGGVSGIGAHSRNISLNENFRSDLWFDVYSRGSHPFSFLSGMGSFFSFRMARILGSECGPHPS